MSAVALDLIEKLNVLLSINIDQHLKSTVSSGSSDVIVRHSAGQVVAFSGIQTCLSFAKQQIEKGEPIDFSLMNGEAKPKQEDSVTIKAAV